MSSREEQESKFFSSDALNDEFFIEIIERKLNIARNKFKVRLVLITPATGKNENYLSVVYRAKINVVLLESNEKRVVNAFIKAMINNNEELKEWNVFIREKFLYENVIASFESIWKERANEDVKFGPKCLKVAEEPYDLLVLDDLKADGYQMLNRKVGVDFQQAKLVLSKLAKFHAASAIRYQTDGELNKHLDRKSYADMFSKEGQFYAWYVNSLDAFRSKIKEFEGFEEISDILAKWIPDYLIDAYFKPGEPMKCGFKILNHGDSWINNMMFKFNDDGSTKNVKLLDYQMSYWGSPAGDLHYFMISSIRNDVKIDHYDELIEFYHTELSEALRKLKYDSYVPTVDEIHHDLKDKRQYAVSLLLDILFICKYDDGKELTLENFTDSVQLSEETSHYYSNDNFCNAVKLWLKFFHKRDFLEPN